MARTKRALNPNNGSGFYHVITRTVAREFLLKDREKEEFTRRMRQAAAFCGIEILTHAVMSNHYHLLIFVPPRPELTESEILRRRGNLPVTPSPEPPPHPITSRSHWRPVPIPPVPRNQCP